MVNVFSMKMAIVSKTLLKHSVRISEHRIVNANAEHAPNMARRVKRMSVRRHIKLRSHAVLHFYDSFGSSVF